MLSRNLSESNKSNIMDLSESDEVFVAFGWFGGFLVFVCHVPFLYKYPIWTTVSFSSYVLKFLYASPCLWGNEQGMTNF